MAVELAEQAPAKINLFLHVIGRRPDGYHLLDSLAVFAGAADRLTAREGDGLTLTVGGPFGLALAQESDNLVLRAARRLADLAGVVPHAALGLEKHLPVASGIGGGSADAAATLRLLCRLWRLTPDGRDLQALAVGLGADVPVCLRSQPARMAGIGEALSPVPALPECGLVLVNPGVAVSTPAVFRARRGDFSALAALADGWPDVEALVTDLATCRNDLEAPAVQLQPEIADVLTALRADPACLLARMSGSGATCFGLYRDATAAGHAAATLQRPGWWCWGGSLRQG